MKNVQKIILAAICILSTQCEGQPTSTTETVTTWTETLSQNVRNLVTDILSADKVSEAAADLPWTLDPNDISRQVQDIHNTLFIWVELLGNIVRDLKSDAEALIKQGSYDTHYWDAEGFNQTVMPGGLLCTIPEEANNTSGAVRYSYDVDFTKTSVRLASDAPRQDTHVIDFVEWSARLDESFAKKQLKTPHVLSQYATYKDKAMRFYPARAWPKTFSGHAVPLDIASRPWYRNAVGSTKNIVFVIDSSGSMVSMSRWRITLDLVGKLFQSISENDNFAVVLAGSTYTDVWSKPWYKSEAELLGCGQGFHPATGSNKKKFMDILERFKPYGATAFTESFKTAGQLFKTHGGNLPDKGCAQAVVFITDEEDTDPDAYCGTGRYSENGNWLPSNLCEYNETDEGIANSLKSEGYEGMFFSYGVLSKKAERTGVTNAACQFRGGIEYVSETGTQTTQAIENFKHWIDKSVPRTTSTWSSPYFDIFGSQKRVLSASVAYSYLNQFYGVVAVDFPLSDIQLYLEETATEYSYAFLINAKGETLVHPYLKVLYKPTEIDAIYPYIEELEMSPDSSGVMQPQAFLTVREEMLAGTDGVRSITGPLRRYTGGEGYGYTTVNIPKKYAYRRIRGTPFTICVVQHATLAGSVKTVKKNSPIKTQNLVSEEAAGVYHRIDLYPNELLRDTYNVQTFKSPRTNLTTGERTGVFIRETCFCNSLLYQTRTAMTDVDITYIDKQINIDGEPARCDFTDVKPYQIRPDCLHDIRTSLDLVSARFKLSTTIDFGKWLSNEVLNRRFTTSLGNHLVLQVRPFHKALNPTQHDFFKISEYNPGLYTIAKPFIDGVSKDAKITFSRAIMKGKDEIAALTCTQDSDCGATLPGVCLKLPTGNTCSSSRVLGVLSTEVPLTKWAAELSLLTRATTVTDNSTACGGSYTCMHSSGNVTCETRCYIMDAAGFVLWNSSSSWENEVTDITPPLPFTEGELMRQLVDVHKGYDKSVNVDQQGECRVADTWTSRYAQKQRVELDVDGREMYESFRNGRTPPMERSHYCPLHTQTFSLNRAVFSNVLTGSLNDGCTQGKYTARLIPSVNAVFVIISNYYSTLAARTRGRPVARDFACTVKNSIFAPSVPAHNLTCPTYPVPLSAYTSNLDPASCSDSATNYC
eukprot:TRINITY_DN4702_c1_g1_i1.p1 TRINITY_DN4702_c1_g1~~TRINITY_DN4702_c1_g1_i1.p1  ORF type:complete len:1179 (+),score=137.66 TRINITY_DN4702_c1_g1_i1:73-3537(+)